MISVIIPVYNCEKYVARCLDSILAQTCPDFEVIVINDASPDGSGGIVKKYAASDSRIKYFEATENHGVSAARNKGIELAEGEYVLFVDGDDALDKNVLERLSKEMREKNLDCASYCFRQIYTDGRPPCNETCGEGIVYYDVKELPDRGNPMNSFIRGRFFSACLSMFRRSILMETHLRFFEGMCVAEDTFFAHTYSLFIKKGCIFADYAGYERYVHSESCLHRNVDPWEHRVKQWFTGCDRLDEYMRKEHRESLVGPLLAMLSWEAFCHYAQNENFFTEENRKEAKKFVSPSSASFKAVMKYAPLRRRLMLLLLLFSNKLFSFALKKA